MPHIFADFTAKMASSFSRISYATKGEVSVKDLYGEAWIVGIEISEKRGYEIDFSDPADQDLVMSHLYVIHIRRGDWNMRSSVRIDQDNDNDDGTAPRWSERLPASDTSDPLVSLLRREAAAQDREKLANSYSQAAAYVAAFVHFKYDRRQMAEYLLIADATLQNRVDLAAAVVTIQPSLFDGRVRIPRRFQPLPGKAYAKQAVTHLGSVQWAWCFDDAAQA